LTLDVHVVTHTHWDREWYHPVERFRQRLVALVDELLDDPPTGSESFLLDGQAIVVEDYLAVRPERADEVRHLLAARRLEAGPWFVLADELIPSGEAIIRNLLTGRRVLARLGATAPPVLYCPDSFGHPAALPSVATGFGLPLIVLWRGFGSARWPSGDTFSWRAPSGDAAIVYHLPRDGYEFGSHLPLDPLAAEARWARMRGELMPRATTGVLLVTNGADHHARQRGFRTALAALERAGADDGVHRSSLSAFAEHLVQRTCMATLPSIHGELRDSYGYAWTLQGTFATRAHEKRMNAAAERALVREAEPWSALAAIHGSSRRPLVQAAWHTLLQAHPHDTLCGCSIDPVAAAMELRVRSAHTQADGIRDDAILDLIGHDPVAAREARDRWRPIVIVRNAVPRSRGGVAILEIEEFIADVPVGPGSVPDPEPVTIAPVTAPTVPALGRLQVLSRAIVNARTESPRHYPDNDLVARTRVAAWVPPVEPFGLRAFAVEQGARRAATRPAPRVASSARSLSNGTLSVAIDDDGTVRVEDSSSTRAIASLLTIVDEADVGDSYTPAPRARDYRADLRRVRRVQRGPWIGSLALDYRIVDGETRHVDAELTVTLSLRAGERLLRIGVVGDNRRENHRVRLRIHGDVVGATVWADAALGPVRRDSIVVTPDDARMEQPPPTAPLHRYVSSFNEQAGLTVFSDGLAEYEPLDDGGFAITLLRAVGELSRNDLPERPGHAGWPTPIPAAQCLGPFEAQLAVLAHGPRTAATIDAIEHAAEDFLLPLVGTPLRSALSLPEPVSGLALVGTGLAFSTLKESEDGEWMVLRCINLRDESVAGRWELPFDALEVQAARLDETPIKQIATDGRRISFEAAPRQILTFLVR
jgi:hypothetical protein